MPNSSSAEKHFDDAAAGSSFRSAFASYYPPTDEELQRFATEGLVVLDTNAVLDLYRFTDNTREQYFDVLELLGDRLWIPNRVGEEFHDNRSNVIRDRQGIRATISDQLNEPLARIVTAIAGSAQRHGLDPMQAAEALNDAVIAGLEPVIGQIEGTVAGLDPDAHPDNDPILARINELFDGKVGAAFDDKQSSAAQKEHSLRMAGHIPPGYRDAKKQERSIGDYLLWKQIIVEATERKLPVLLVTNEKKEDWIFRDGAYVMPRVELVREMRSKADCSFHLVDVQTYLTLANRFLAAKVSEAAVEEAARVGDSAAAAATAHDAAHIATTLRTLSAFDPTAGLRDAMESYDTTAALQQMMSNLDLTAGVRDAMASFDPTAGIRDAMANYDTTAAIRQMMSSFDPTAGIRDAAGITNEPAERVSEPDEDEAGRPSIEAEGQKNIEPTESDDD
ncbi:PIN-like domain-containing protein [Nocardia asteroides]